MIIQLDCNFFSILLLMEWDLATSSRHLGRKLLASTFLMLIVALQDVQLVGDVISERPCSFLLRLDSMTLCGVDDD